MRNHSNRLNKLEKKIDPPQPVTWDAVKIDGGVVAKVYSGAPELIGKTEAEIDSLYAARDVNIIKIFNASQ